MAAAIIAGACRTSEEAQRTPQDNQRGSTTLDESTLGDAVTLNRKAEGFNGLWYMNQPLDNEYRFKYSGGLATYTAKHRPFAVYSREANKTFFTFGGTKRGSHERYDLTSMAERQSPTPGALLHMVSYYDHETGMVGRPTVLLDKLTRDAHDNPVISIDDSGYIWIFSTSHGRSRPSYIHRSREPYDINGFQLVRPTKIEDGEEVPMTNFSYIQPWHLPGQGFVTFVTRYNYPVARTIAFMTSRDGVSWSEWKRIATMDEGHYQISAASDAKAGSAFNMHPKRARPDDEPGLNFRTNLYYVETEDFGRSWQAADGTPLELPLSAIENPALVHDYKSEGLLVYLKDIRYDEAGRPVILYITSRGFESGPEKGPRTWRTAQWTGLEWKIDAITTSDNNYDMGSLYIEDDEWRIIAPTEQGAQPYNPGGEVAMWVGRMSSDGDRQWTKVKQLTSGGPFNHTYVRRPVDARPDFYAFWADGHGRQPSESRLYFAMKDGRVFRLPQQMEGDLARPEQLGAPSR